MAAKVTKIFLRAATITLYLFAFMRITDNTALLKYLYAPDDKSPTAKVTTPNKSVPLATEIKKKP
jgi:hypothetical protein